MSSSAKNIAIGSLSITAVILLVGILLVNAIPAPVQAGSVSSYGGDFTVTIGRVTRDAELIYLVDNTTERLLVYGLQRKTGRVAILDKAEISQGKP
ncbi:MAG: hypothetical protein GXP29_02485 [Planctomycetes bacterium]|nr:hypothetical protein [Planctomycetota bacterium]